MIIVEKLELGVKYCGRVATLNVTATKLLLVEMLPFELIRGPLKTSVLAVMSSSVPSVAGTNGVRPFVTATLAGS